jgi:ribosomal protein S1
LDGKVSNITDAGIFVQAGAIFGLVDWRAVSWNLELDFRDARKVGDKVSARVLKVDQARERVLFDIRDTELDPWIDFARTHHIGQLVFGRAVSVLPHCAYFELSWGVYGYAQISELTHEIPRRATEVVRPGDEMWLKIVGHDPMSKYELTASRMYPERAKSTAKSGSNHRSAFSHVNADGKPKAEFQTFVDAEMSIRDIQKTLPRGVHLYSYVCDTCQLWHFGSRTEEFWTLSKVRVESEGGEVAPEWQHTVSDDSAERLESSGDGN